jgi:hypothetical protein
LIKEYVDKKKIEGVDRKLKGMSTNESTDAQFDEAVEEVNNPEVACKLEDNVGLEAEEYTENFLSHALA